jgi:hypothetical protein
VIAGAAPPSAAAAAAPALTPRGLLGAAPGEPACLAGLRAGDGCAGLGLAFCGVLSAEASKLGWLVFSVRTRVSTHMRTLPSAGEKWGPQQFTVRLRRKAPRSLLPPAAQRTFGQRHERRVILCLCTQLRSQGGVQGALGWRRASLPSSSRELRRLETGSTRRQGILLQHARRPLQACSIVRLALAQPECADRLLARDKRQQHSSAQPQSEGQ